MKFMWYFTIKGESFRTKNKNEYDFMKAFAKPEMAAPVAEMSIDEIRLIEQDVYAIHPAKMLIDEIRLINKAKKYDGLEHRLRLNLSKEFLEQKKIEHVKKISSKLGLNKMRFITNEFTNAKKQVSS